MKRYRLRNVEVTHLSIVNKGANRKRFFLRKADGASEPTDVQTLPAEQRIVKTADWSSVFCVVAEPDAVESGGLLAPDVEDVWDSPDEIRKAAHGFMKNGALITQMHESLEPYGQLVESAVALEDFHVEGATIKKGTWYVGIEPNSEGKRAIEAGDFTGVSLDGRGERLEADPILKEGSDERVGLLRRVAKALGLDAEGAGLATVATQTHEEDDVDADTKKLIEDNATQSKDALEKASAAVTAITALSDKFDQVLERLPKPEEKAPTVEDLDQKLTKAVTELTGIAKGIDALAAGSSSQTGSTETEGNNDGEVINISKSEKTGPIGLLR